jgi:hypothetical protein
LKKLHLFRRVSRNVEALGADMCNLSLHFLEKNLARSLLAFWITNEKILFASEVDVNSSTQVMIRKAPEFSAARNNQEREIESVVHSLREQACTLALGIGALQYRDEPERERQQYVAVLEGVVDEMNRQFQRLDHWLVEEGFKPRLEEPSAPGRSRRMRKHPVRA